MTVFGFSVVRAELRVDVSVEYGGGYKDMTLHLDMGRMGISEDMEFDMELSKDIIRAAESFCVGHGRFPRPQELEEVVERNYYGVRRGWREWPSERPSRTGEYLVRGIGGLNNKLHHWVCLWVGESEDSEISCKFFYGGNEFAECREFEWMDVMEL